MGSPFFPSFGPMKSALSAWHYPRGGVNAQGRQAPQERRAAKACGEKNTTTKKNNARKREVKRETTHSEVY